MAAKGACSASKSGHKTKPPPLIPCMRTRVNKSPGFDKVEFEKYVSSGFRWPTTSAFGAVLLALQLVKGILTSSSLNMPFSKYQQSAGGHWDYEVRQSTASDCKILFFASQES